MFQTYINNYEESLTLYCVVYQRNKVKWGKNLYKFLEEFGWIFLSSLFSQDKLFQFKKGETRREFDI